MLTRRTALGAGLAVASLACAPGVGTAAAARRPEARSIDTLLIDDGIEMPEQMAAFVQARRGTASLVALQLDAAAQAELMRVLSSSKTVVGISSGATLFCVERMAWDHGFRLKQRSERRPDAAGDDAFQQDVAAFLSGADAGAAGAVRAYRPSRADGLLHAWVLQKSGPQLRQNRREV